MEKYKSNLDEEIKKQLKSLNNWLLQHQIYKKYNLDSRFTFELEDLQNFYDYITRLEKQIETLLKDRKKATDLFVEYKQRIDKAIEYIKEHSEMTDLQICGIENVLAFRGSAKELLKILGDKE